MKFIRSELDLEYDDADSIRGVLVDLNGDGIKDYLVQSSPRLCGNGGCPYALFDGASGKELGQLFGSLLYIRAEQAKGYPLIDTYSSLGASSATYAFDGTAYVAGSARSVEGVSLDSLVTSLRRIPRWRPHL